MTTTPRETDTPRRDGIDPRLARLAALSLTGGESSLHDVLQQIAESATDLLALSAGASIILWDADAETYTAASSTVEGQLPGVPTRSVRSSGGATRWVIDNRRRIVVSDTAANPFGASRLVEEFGIGAYVGAPLITADGCLGVLYILDYSPRQYTDEDLALVDILSQRAADTIATAQLLAAANSAHRRSEAMATAMRGMMAAESPAAALGALCYGIVSGLGATSAGAHRMTSGAEVLDSIEAPSGGHLDISLLESDSGADIRQLEAPLTWIGPDEDCGAVAPLSFRDGTFGVAAARRAKPLTSDELAWFTSLASSATLAVNNVLLTREIEATATLDPLTTLHNRRWLADVGERAIELAMRYDREISLAVLDIDHFKTINDQVGHLGGDYVLQAVSAIMTDTVRGTDLLARYGGEEFVIILPETEPDAAASMIERLRQRIAGTPISLGESNLGVTISAGVTALRDRLGDLESLVAEADLALLEAKANGRNRVVLATP